LKTLIPSFMIYGEFCRAPLGVSVKMRMMKYWVKLLQGKNTKLLYILYKLLYTLYERNESAKFKLIECIQGIPVLYSSLSQ
jgi:hypothetical protein